MKSNLFCTCTLGVFLVCAIYTAWLTFRYFVSLQQLQQLQNQYLAFSYTRSAVQALANEAVEYSKTNAAIDPILQQYDLKPKPGATNAPAQAPAKTSGQ